MAVKVKQIVVFGMGKELYGVGIDAIHEIIKVPEITAVPDAPPFLEGMINLRGKILPVIDLRKRLRLPESPRGRQTRVLITEDAGRLIGLVVDSVSEVLKYDPAAVEGTPDIITSIGVDYIAGMVKVQERLITLLDFAKILSVEEIRKSLTGEETGSTNQAA
jgi:purine-binding chemotaxis protein CheW